MSFGMVMLWLVLIWAFGHWCGSLGNEVKRCEKGTHPNMTNEAYKRKIGYHR